MDRTIWKLDHIGERLWTMAALTAAHAASLENGGKGLAVVAEETRWAGEHIRAAVEKAAVEEEGLNKAFIIDLTDRLNLLAFNCAIEASRIIGFTGKQAAIYADEIRQLADEIFCLFDEERAARRKRTVSPWAAVPSSAAKKGEFLLLHAGGIPFVEPLTNIQEVCVASAHESSIGLRGTEYPLIDLYQRLGKERESRTHVIVRTPWAEENRSCAVAADVSFIFFSPIGRPAEVPSDMPLAGYVRECWENENGEPFYFMDWPRMLSADL